MWLARSKVNEGDLEMSGCRLCLHHLTFCVWFCQDTLMTDHFTGPLATIRPKSFYYKNFSLKTFQIESLLAEVIIELEQSVAGTECTMRRQHNLNQIIWCLITFNEIHWITLLGSFRNVCNAPCKALARSFSSKSKLKNLKRLLKVISSGWQWN